MIKITKDNSTLTVTRGAFENTFKALGYKIEGASNKVKEENVKDAIFEESKVDTKQNKKVDSKKS